MDFIKNAIKICKAKNLIILPVFQGGCKREIQDFFVALGEGLINMTSNTDIQRLGNIIMQTYIFELHVHFNLYVLLL